MIRTPSSGLRANMEKVKGSRFIADLTPVSSHVEAMTFLEGIRRREHSATHHAWAYRLAGGRVRSSDDGEPAGTAGAPILRRLEGVDLSDILIVVTRYYGGTNLGRGGLIRAYGAAAQAALDDAEVVTLPMTAGLRLVFPYDLVAVAEAAISTHQAVVTAASYAADVTLDLQVPLARVEAIAASLIDGSAGRVVIIRTGGEPGD